MDMLSMVENLVIDILLNLINTKQNVCYLFENKINAHKKYIFDINKPCAYTQLMLFLCILYNSIQKNEFITKRAIYYENPRIFHNQYRIDFLLEKICRLFNVGRLQLKTIATSKAIAYGDVQINTDDDHHISFKHSIQGVGLLSCVLNENVIECTAKFILVIEKDATLQKVLGSNFYEQYKPNFIITAKGYPDLATRSFLKLICEKYPNLPVFALVDADPHGISIFLTYKYGSKNASMKTRDDQFANVPRIKLIGLLPSELNVLQIKSDDLLPLTDADKIVIQSIKLRSYYKYESDIQHELCAMEAFGRKAEIQCLDSLGSEFLCSEYLPRKLHQEGIKLNAKTRIKTSGFFKV